MTKNYLALANLRHRTKTCWFQSSFSCVKKTISPIKLFGSLTSWQITAEVSAVSATLCKCHGWSFPSLGKSLGFGGMPLRIVRIQRNEKPTDEWKALHTQYIYKVDHIVRMFLDKGLIIKTFNSPGSVSLVQRLQVGVKAVDGLLQLGGHPGLGCGVWTPNLIVAGFNKPLF